MIVLARIRRIRQLEIQIAQFKAAYADDFARQFDRYAEQAHPLPCIRQGAHLRQQVPGVPIHEGDRLREGFGQRLQPPCAVQVDAVFPGHGVAAAEHASLIVDGVFSVKIGIFEVQTVVALCGQGIVHGGVQHVKRTAAGGQPHVGVDVVIEAGLELAEHRFIVAKIRKGHLVRLQNIAHDNSDLLRQRKPPRGSIVRIVQDRSRCSIQLLGERVLDLVIHGVDQPQQIQRAKAQQRHSAAEHDQIDHQPPSHGKVLMPGGAEKFQDVFRMKLHHACRLFHPHCMRSRSSASARLSSSSRTAVVSSPLRTRRT